MKKQIIFFCLLICIFLSACKDESTGSKSGKRILVFAKTAGFRHSSIPNGKAAIQKLGKENTGQQTKENNLFFHFTVIVCEKGTKYKCKK